MTLTGNTILITGGTSGIGRALAIELDRAGNSVIICGRRADRLAAIHEEHPGIAIRTCDVAVPEDRVRLVEWVVDAHPDVNVLVNNAGLQLLFDATAPVDLERVRREIEVNLVAPLHLTSLLGPQLAGRPGAMVVNVTSGLAYAPMAGVGLYCATKAALHSLTLSMRRQFRDLGVRVVELAPPAVDTELGAERRTDPEATHGGLPVAEFVAAALTGFADADDDILVGFAALAKANPDQAYARMNG